MIDESMVEKRLYFSIMQISLYKNNNGNFPSDINSIFKKENFANNESECHFYDVKIPGWGYCYYSIIDGDFFIDIRGAFTALTYRSDLDIIDSSYNYDL